MKGSLLSLAGALALLSGCTITATSASEELGPSNTCSDSSDCAIGHCQQGVCQTTNGQLESLLIEVTPSSDSGQPHIPLLTHLENISTSGGEQAIVLEHAAQIIGSLRSDGSCQPVFNGFGAEGGAYPPSSDLSLPVTVRLTPRAGLLGLPSQTYMAKTDGVTPQGEYRFKLQVPAGDYDVYLAPPAQQQAGCAVPPQFFRQFAIAGGEFQVNYVATVASTLKLDVHFPLSPPGLDGWVADMIEPNNGNPISTQAVLAAPELLPEDKGYSYAVALDFSSVRDSQAPTDASRSATDLVRFRPPAGVVAPTIFLDRAGLGLFLTAENQDAVVVEILNSFSAPVTVEGQLARLDDGAPVAGSVNLVSTKIFGVDPGVFAAYQTSVDVDESGVFQVLLPPGEYRVYAVPPLVQEVAQEPGRSSLSAHEVAWTVPADLSFQAGKVIELPPLARVSGKTTLPGAQVQVVASPQSVLPFDKVFGAAAFVPRATQTLADGAGQFSILADPGRFDVSIRASEASGFAWSVRPGFEVRPGEARQDLAGLARPEPSLLTGKAVISYDEGRPTEPVPFALIRAYAYLDQDGAYTRDLSEARSVIQVAETRSDESAAFRLLVPASIDASK